MRLRRILSGGQTGVDRAALESARAAGLEVGGWCPPGRQAEDGVLPADLPLLETPRERSPRAPDIPRSLRTEWNVRDSGGTLILRPAAGSVHPGILDPGSEWTRRCAELYGRPLLELDPISEDVAGNAAGNADDGVADILGWLEAEGVEILNVAGPSEMAAPANARAARRLLDAVFRAVRAPSPRSPRAPRRR